MRNRIILFATFLIIVFWSACKHDPAVPQGIFNNQTLAEIVANSNKNYYQDTMLIRQSVQESAHLPWFRLWMNDVAAAALGPDGKLPPGNLFPDSALIVKELYNSATGPLQINAIMMKLPDNAASANGWLWAYLNPDGSTNISIFEKGSSCTGCHSATPNRDFTRVFDYH